MNHKIPFAEAEMLIANFVNHPVLGDVARNKALGGTIAKDSFQPQENPSTGLWSGKMGWYCWDTRLPHAYHPFFLAFEQFNHYDSTAVPGQPGHDYLQVANDQFTYVTGQNIGQLLLNQQQAFSNPINQKVTKAEVIPFVHNFANNFPPYGSNSPFNTQPFGFFNNSPIGGGQCDWEAFIGQTGLQAIRYYFGYDSSEAVNKIRIILVGVDTYGKNMLTNTTNDLILERCDP
ncbi:MAG TPA: hypothetical protein VJ911_00355 [Cryomorphaceae bacterium]|nr:hypothetical protein [Cryomorphaceae bacterium]